MLRNYIKIAWRHLLKARFHSAVNLFGLAIGIGFTLLVAAYVWGEVRVNKDLRNADRQYIVQSRWKDPNMGLDLTTFGPLVKALKQQYPHLVANCYRWDGVTSNVSKGDAVFREGLQIGDSTLLTMYGFNLLYGDAATALNEPFTTVITEDRAVKYFGRKDVLGQTLTIESFSGSKHDFKITGVMQKPQDNSVTHVTPENDNQVYIPAASIAYFNRTLDNWGDPYRVGYVELQQGVTVPQVESAMRQLLKDNASAQTVANMQPYLLPLKDYYLNQNNGLVRKMLYTVSAIALFILLMAVINFVNLSIGRSAARLKEIGLRKVMGGRRRQLVFQFLVESVLLVAVATVLALGIYAAGRPFVSEVLGKGLSSLSGFPIVFFAGLFVFVFLIGILAGIYPAFVLSNLKTTDSVKGKTGSVGQNILLRKSLVGFQVCTAAVVFAGALITVQQVSLFFSKSLGYNKDYVLSVGVPRDWTSAGLQRMEGIRNRFAAMPEMSGVSLGWSVPDGQGAGSYQLYEQGKDSAQTVAYENLKADEHYLDVLGLPLVAGRYFKQPADSLNVVVNERAVAANGWKSAEEAVGKRLFFNSQAPVTVIGVVKDFHFGSMKQAIAPLVMTHPQLDKIYRLLVFRFKPGNLSSSLDGLQKQWAALLPGAAFEYKFMDDSLNFLYASEIRLKKACQIALVLAVVIVLLGISGLLSLSVQKRTKEIGVRKVVGASASNVIALFLKDFIPVVFVGGLVSIPIAWYLMRGWLNDYAYRIDISPLPFAVSVIGIALLATAVITLQIAKISRENPVKSLRTE